MTDLMMLDGMETLITHPEMTEDEWLEAGEMVAVADREIPWIAGDWIHHGDSNYRDGRDMAVKTLTHLSPSTVARYAFVAKRFPPERRLNISFWHHSEVAALPPEVADMILDEAIEKRLSQQDVRNLAQQAKAELKGRMPELDTDRLKLEKKRIQQAYYTEYYVILDRVESHPEQDTVEISRDLFLALKAKIPKPKADE